jgi:mannose-6-phosphate isomerase-like protein (cupin superfamily)
MMRRILWLFVIVVLSSTSAAASDIRRVVTGIDATNKAVVLLDNRLTLVQGPYGITSVNLWLTDSYPPGYSKDDPVAKPVGIWPADNGTRFRVIEFPPLDSATEAKMEAGFLQKTVGERAPSKGLPVSHPLMHRTRTVDYAVVLSGEIEMTLDDSVVQLKAGDVIIQQATNHAWINRGPQPCRILFVLMDAKQP